MPEKKLEQGLNHEGIGQPIPLVDERGSGRWFAKLTLLAAATTTASTFVMGETLMAVRNAGFLGMNPASAEGMVDYRVVMGLLSGLGALYMWGVLSHARVENK